MKSSIAVVDIDVRIAVGYHSILIYTGFILKI